MSLLLDTHVAVWWWCAPERLSAGMLDRLKDGSTVVFFSAVSALEIALKHRLGKLPLPPGMADRLEQHAVEEGWSLLPISVRHAQLAGGWDVEHRDPFDRLLAAQAHLDNLELATADAVFRQFAVRRTW